MAHAIGQNPLMPRGPHYFPSKGACIYCGATNVPLKDEHIVPLSLGGTHVIRDASCAKCEDITKRFEQKVARDLWGDARTSFNAPTRRKKERRTHIEMQTAEDPNRQLLVPAGEYPAGFVFYKMDRAGILRGMSEDKDLSKYWQVIVLDDDKRRKAFIEKYPAHKPVLKFRHVPDAFGRLLAKIGYGQTLTLLDPGDFRPLCLPYITGEKRNVSYVVGGTLADQLPEPDNGYRLSTLVIGDLSKMFVVAEVRLYANTHAPAYHVVAGDVLGPVEVDRILKKLAANGGGIKPVMGPTKHWESTSRLG